MAYELIDVIVTYMKYGYLTVAAAIPSVKVGDVAFNILNIESQIVEADSKGAEVITFPELSITGYTCQDLFRQNTLIDAAEAGVLRLLEFTHQMDIVAIVGAPVIVGSLLLNCAIVLQHGEIPVRNNRNGRIYIQPLCRCTWRIDRSHDYETVSSSPW